MFPQRLLPIVVSSLLAACVAPESEPRSVATQEEAMRASGKAGWLKGSAHSQIDTIARHLRGNDLAMWEVGYRYSELYWAGANENWDLADYQLTKIRLAIDLAIERRPGRKASYAVFFERGLPPIKSAIDAGSKAAFDRGFADLTEACNACHVDENLSFFLVVAPNHRPAPLAAP